MESQGLLTRSLEELLPRIRERREEIERARRLPADLVDDLRRTGLFALEVPRAIGGQQADPLDSLRAIETVARADGSTGWCAMVAITNNGAAGFTREEGAREVFTDPSIPTAGVFAPSGAAVPVEGGMRVSGRWAFASGISHSPWLWAGCVVMEGGSPRMTPMGPEIVYAWMPTSAVEIHDTWFVTGLCGTASNDVSARDVFVPARRVFSMMDPSGHDPAPLYRMPLLGWFVSHVAAVSVGIARGALDELIAAAGTKVPTFSAAVLADRAATQLEVARAEATLGAARALVHEAVTDVWRTVVAGEPASARQNVLLRLAAAHAVQAAAGVTRVATVLSGGSAIQLASSLQRHMRDAEAITHHFSVSPHVWEDAGRVLLGRPPLAPMF